MTAEWHTASAPGKFVVLGEHSVVYGKPALVLATDRRITCSVRRSSHFTVNGEHLDSYDQAAFYEGNECIWDGYFHESETRSAPYFDIIIDGINVL